MGDPFLRTYYSIYDLENKKSGLVGIGQTTKLENYEEDVRPVTDKVEKWLTDVGIT